MAQLKNINEGNFLVGEKKDKKGEFIHYTLPPQEEIIIENIPWITQSMLDWNVQVL